MSRRRASTSPRYDAPGRAGPQRARAAGRRAGARRPAAADALDDASAVIADAAGRAAVGAAAAPARHPRSRAPAARPPTPTSAPRAPRSSRASASPASAGSASDELSGLFERRQRAAGASCRRSRLPIFDGGANCAPTCDVAEGRPRHRRRAVRAGDPDRVPRSGRRAGAAAARSTTSSRRSRRWSTRAERAYELSRRALSTRGVDSYLDVARLRSASSTARSRS